MAKNFVHLHTHSHYSLLDGLSKVEELVATAKEMGMPALAITDHGNMHGAIEFYKLAKKEGIKPIIGVEAYIANRSHLDKQPNLDNERYHLTLLVKNYDGYKNLIKLVTASHLQGFYYKPRMDRELLRAHSKGIVALSGCLGGELATKFWNKDREEAKKLALEYQEIFGKENYFLEIMYHPKLERSEEIRKEIVSLARELDIPLVATYDSHYLKHEDNKAHDTLVAISTSTDLTDADRLTNTTEDFAFISPEEADEFFKDTPDAVDNTAKIAEMCNVEIPLGKWVFPDIKIESGLSHDDELRRLTFEGIAKRGLQETDEVKNRIEYELKIIKDKGYSPYFLVVADLLKFSRENGILTNIRGSVAGSITTYLTFITNVNPLEFNLPFERFLNPERPSAPDIDMDFADNRREEVIEYAKRKYGEDHVAQIGTFGTMMAKGSVRDVTRALAYPYDVGDRIAKMIPEGSQGFAMTLKRAMEENAELKKAYDSEPITKEILDLAMKLEGCVRHCSVHAAGVVIAPTPLSEWTPLQYEPKGKKIITQYDMYVIEDVGLLKYDFLGIRNLAILGDAVKNVREILGTDVDLEKIPVNDKKTFEMLARGETMGLFQLNGSGMTKYLKELQPSTIHDINAMVALYRPGPIESIPEYIERKHNPNLVKYLDPRMAKILDKSFGVITYQDDVMMIAIELGGYSWLEADKLRKAMGKKIPKEMSAQKEKLLAGLVKKGMAEAKVDELWALIEPFAAYGFNKAHAASYGRVAYQTAYMKANFPAEYMTAVLSAESDDLDKIAEIMQECKRMGLPVLAPDVNESAGQFTLVKKEKSGKPTDEIRFGLYAIKNLGTEIANAVIAERNKNGAYKSFTDFLDRVRHRNLNKKSLEALIKAGAMDNLDERGKLLGNLETALEYSRECSKSLTSQTSLFGLMTDFKSVPTLKMKECVCAGQMEKLAWEKELLGLYLSGHPLDRFRSKFEKKENRIEYAKTLRDQQPAVIGGIVQEVRAISTKKGEMMAFVKIADLSGVMEAVVFPRVYLSHRELLVPDKCIIVRGKISLRNGEPSVLADGIKELV